MDPNKIIDSLGGTSAVAALCKIKPASVSEWRTKGIPSARLQFFQVIRPELFGAEADQQPNEVVLTDRRHLSPGETPAVRKVDIPVFTSDPTPTAVAFPDRRKGVA